MIIERDIASVSGMRVPVTFYMTSEKKASRFRLGKSLFITWRVIILYKLFYSGIIDVDIKSKICFVKMTVCN